MAINKVKGTDLNQSLPKAQAGPDDYELQSHLDTLHKAADIMSKPGLLRKVHKLAGRKHKALMGMTEPKIKPIKSLEELKERAAKGPKEPNEPDEDDMA